MRINVIDWFLKVLNEKMKVVMFCYNQPTTSIVWGKYNNKYFDYILLYKPLVSSVYKNKDLAYFIKEIHIFNCIFVIPS